MKTRIDDHAETNFLHSKYQLGFRRNIFIFSPAKIPHHAVDKRLKNTKRTYTCFVDFKKCFDPMDRSLLFIKFQCLGIPQSLCNTLDFIYRNLKFHIKSENLLSEIFTTSVDLTQGCFLSQTLYLLFVHDIGNCFSHDGLEMNGE